MRTTRIVLYPLERRMFYVDGADFEIEPLTNMILHAQRKEKFTLGERLRDGHVACAA
jgi:hypothetical protein